LLIATEPGDVPALFIVAAMLAFLTPRGDKVGADFKKFRID
jgi:hypothetical protein